MPRKTAPELHKKGSLITFTERERECCLNYRWHIPSFGVFDPNFGKVEVTPEDAKLHNEALDQALIDGVDNRCEVGQGSMFYLRNGQVVTWLGTVVGPALVRDGRHYTFARAGKEFRAKKNRRRGDDSIWVQRIS
jgi:hypothetical protein